MKPFIALPVLLLSTLPTLADGGHAIHQKGAVTSPEDSAKIASFDILAAHVHRDGRTVTFHMTLNGKAGADTPAPVGERSPRIRRDRRTRPPRRRPTSGPAPR